MRIRIIKEIYEVYVFILFDTTKRTYQSLGPDSVIKVEI